MREARSPRLRVPVPGPSGLARVGRASASRSPPRLGAALAAFMLLASCSVGPVYRKPAVLTGDAPAPELVNTAEPVFDKVAPLPPKWWKLYDDTLLDGLVEKALVHNTDLRVALATLEQLEAALSAAENKLEPQGSLSAMASVGHVAINGTQSIAIPKVKSYSATETVTYDLDLFGALRSAVEESRADVEAVQAAVDLARVNIAAQVAKAYAQACAAGEQIVLADRSILLAQENLDITKRQYRVGTSNINDVVKAETQVRQAASQKPTYITQQRSSLYTLSTLVGDPPAAFPPAVAACDRPPIVRRAIPVGDGASLLARRPDIRAAERKLAGSIADIDASTAELYPSISIGGLVGVTRSSLAGQSATRINLWSFGSMLSWSVPNLGAARAKIAESNASARSALAAFDGQVLTALKEAESALVTLAQQIDAENELAAARIGTALSTRYTEDKYSIGVGKISDVLSARKSLLEADTSLANARAQVSQDQVALFKALGGGWQEAPPIAETSLAPVIAASGARRR